MVKLDFIHAIQRKEEISLQEAEDLVNQLLEIIKETLEKGDEVLISGFGKFELRNKKARFGRDPKSKKEYPIDARRVITFYPSKVWLDEINEKI